MSATQTSCCLVSQYPKVHSLVYNSVIQPFTYQSVPRYFCQIPLCATLDAVLSVALLNTAAAAIPQVLFAVWPIFPSHSTADASPWLDMRVRGDK